MGTKLNISDWVGSTLTNGAVLDFAERVHAVYAEQGFDALSMTDIGMKLTAALDAFKLAVNRQSAYDETSAVARADTDRDACFKALYHAWNYLGALSPTHPLAAHVETLKSEMNAYKGVWSHEMRKETTELMGLQSALATDENQAALAALGLDKIAAALWAANDAARAAMESRSDERSSRAEEKASGTTPELRKAVTTLLVQAAHRVNAVLELNPDNPNVCAAVSKVAALIEEYKQVAAQAKHRKGDTPAPEPEPEPTPEPEASVS
jgi:hypothetical protein